MIRRPLALCAALACASGCTEANPDNLQPRNERFGPDGGQLVVGTGEISLTVPPGALGYEVFLGVEGGDVSAVAGMIAAGGAYAFTPPGTGFAMPVAITIPYDPARVSPAVAGAELRVGFRDVAGQVTMLTPASIDASLGRVTFMTTVLGTTWVLAPDVISATGLFPLADGDEYRFEDGVVLQVERTTTEPNLAPLEVAKVRITRSGQFVAGLYLSDAMDQLTLLGEFAEPAYQWVLAVPILLVDTRDPLGTTRQATESYDGFAPFGAMASTFEGLADTTTTIAERARLTLELGTFDTVRVPIRIRFDDTSPAQGEQHFEFWFATGTGPVAIALAEGAAPLDLLGGILAGEPLAPN